MANQESNNIVSFSSSQVKLTSEKKVEKLETKLLNLRIKNVQQNEQMDEVENHLKLEIAKTEQELNHVDSLIEKLEAHRKKENRKHRIGWIANAVVTLIGVVAVGGAVVFFNNVAASVTPDEAAAIEEQL